MMFLRGGKYSGCGSVWLMQPCIIYGIRTSRVFFFFFHFYAQWSSGLQATGIKIRPASRITNKREYRCDFYMKSNWISLVAWELLRRFAGNQPRNKKRHVYIYFLGISAWIFQHFKVTWYSGQRLHSSFWMSLIMQHLAKWCISKPYGTFFFFFFFFVVCKHIA